MYLTKTAEELAEFDQFRVLGDEEWRWVTFITYMDAVPEPVVYLHDQYGAEYYLLFTDLVEVPDPE